jgi:hypothetical protein
MYIVRLLSDSNPQNLTFTDLFQNQQKGYLVLTHSMPSAAGIEKINAHILERVIQLNIPEMQEDEIKEVLKEFFVELNWQIYSKFRMSIIDEHGISFLMFILYYDKVFVVQFGRLVAGMIQNNKFKEIGKSWDNFPIKTKEDLFLLGGLDRDIFVKIHTLDLHSDTVLFALPAAEAKILQSEFTVDLNCLENYLTSKKKEGSSPFFLVQYKHSSTKKGSFFRRLWGRK